MTRKMVEMWECPDCGFEMNAIHIDDNGGAHTCPACHEVNARKEVRWFAERMENKLKENDHKGGWGDCDLQYLYTRLGEETKELLNELQAFVYGENNHDKVISEAADIANFAMMIADRVKQFDRI